VRRDKDRQRAATNKVGITMDLYPGMQEDAAAHVDRDLEAVLNRRSKNFG
jgi:hypothetical protein